MNITFIEHNKITVDNGTRDEKIRRDETNKKQSLLGRKLLKATTYPITSSLSYKKDGQTTQKPTVFAPPLHTIGYGGFSLKTDGEF